MYRSLTNTVRLFTFQQPVRGSFPSSARAAYLMVVFYLAMRVLSQVIMIWPVGGFEFWAIPQFMTAVAIEFGILLGVIALLPPDRGGLRIVMVYTAVMSVYIIVLSILYRMGYLFGWSTLEFYGFFAIFIALFLVRLPRFAQGAGLVTSVVLGFAIIGSQAAQIPFTQHAFLFKPAGAAQEQSSDYDYVPVDVENLYQSQSVLLAQEYAALSTIDDIEEPRLFAILGAGTAHQRVFIREVRSISDILSKRFGDETTRLHMANAVHEPTAYPLANRQNTARMMSATAAVADPEKDVTMIYLTSHGAPNLFSLSFYEAGTTDMSAQDLASMLDQSGLTNVVVVISACYAGSFIDELAAPDRVIITAADADSKSFGCSDQNEWTWFGDALFNHGLQEHANILDAFALAKAKVAVWEEEAGFAPSNPQIFVGDAMPALLDALGKASLTAS